MGAPQGRHSALILILEKAHKLKCFKLITNAENAFHGFMEEAGRSAPSTSGSGLNLPAPRASHVLGAGPGAGRCSAGRGHPSAAPPGTAPTQPRHGAERLGMAGLCYPQQGGYCRAAAAMNLLLGVFHVLLPCFRPGEAQGQGERGAGSAGAGDDAAGGSPGRPPRWQRGDTKEPGRAPLPCSPALPYAPGPGAAGTCVLSLSARSHRAHPRSGGAVAGRGGRASAARAGEGVGGRLRGGCRGGVAAGPDCQAASMFPGAASPAHLPPLALVGRLLLACAFSFCEIFF